MALFIPFRAAMDLFTYILRDPGAVTAHSDLTLMEVAAGYAFRLEFTMDGSMSFPFIKDFTRFARAAVDRAKAPGYEDQAFTSQPTRVANDAQSAALEEHSRIAQDNDNDLYQEVRDIAYYFSTNAAGTVPALYLCFEVRADNIRPIFSS